MKYLIEVPSNLAEMDYEEQRIAVLKSWEESNSYACPVMPQGTQTIDWEYYAVKKEDKNAGKS